MGVKLLRGQVATGRKQLSVELGISERGIRTAIDHLKKSHEIDQQPTSKSTRKFSIITICNYDSWVRLTESTDQQTDQQPTSKSTNNRPLTDQQQETEKESLMVLSPTPPISFTIEKEKDKEKEKKVKRKFDVREDLSYVNAEYLNIWMEWLDFKDKINKQYKTDAGVKKQYQHLVNLSNGDVNKAKAIVDQSIMREYEGLFDVKDYKPNVVSIDEQAEKDGFPYKGEDGRHYETRYDMARRQDSYEEWIKQRKK